MKETIYIVLIMLVLSTGILLISPSRDQDQWHMNEYGVIPTSQSAISPFRQSTSRYQYNPYANFDNDKDLIDPLPEFNIISPTPSISTNNNSNSRETLFTQNFVSASKTQTASKLNNSGSGNSGLALALGGGRNSQRQVTSGGSAHLQTWNEGQRDYFSSNQPLLAPSFDDYIEDDITHPGGSPTDEPLFNVPVGEGYMILFSFGLLFLIGKVVFMRRA